MRGPAYNLFAYHTDGGNRLSVVAEGDVHTADELADDVV